MKNTLSEFTQYLQQAEKASNQLLTFIETSDIQDIIEDLPNGKNREKIANSVEEIICSASTLGEFTAQNLKQIAKLSKLPE